MTELRNYILSKLQEQLGKAERNPAGQKAVADWKMKRRVGREGGPVRVGQSDTGEDASIAAEKKAGKLTGKLLSRGSRGLGQTKGGMRGWSNIQQGHSADARQDASTDLRTQLMYILADKLDEVINPSFKVDKEEVEARKTRGMKPFPTTNKPTPNRAELMRDAAKAAAEAAKKPMPKITDVDVSQYLPKPKPSPESLIVPSKPPLFMGNKPPVKEWTERIIKILVEMKRPAHLKADEYKISGAAKLQGLPQINKLRASRGLRPHPRSPLASDPNIMKKSAALGSVFSSQPLGPTEKAKVEADKAKEAADRPRVEAGLAKFDRDPVVSGIRRNNRRWNR